MHKFALAFSLCSTVGLFAADTPQERLSDATKVFNEIMVSRGREPRFLCNPGTT